MYLYTTCYKKKDHPNASPLLHLSHDDLKNIERWINIVAVEFKVKNLLTFKLFVKFAHWLCHTPFIDVYKIEKYEQVVFMILSLYMELFELIHQVSNMPVLAQSPVMWSCQNLDFCSNSAIIYDKYIHIINADATSHLRKTSSQTSTRSEFDDWLNVYYKVNDKILPITFYIYVTHYASVIVCKFKSDYSNKCPVDDRKMQSMSSTSCACVNQELSDLLTYCHNMIQCEKSDCVDNDQEARITTGNRHLQYLNTTCQQMSNNTHTLNNNCVDNSEKKLYHTIKQPLGFFKKTLSSIKFWKKNNYLPLITCTPSSKQSLDYWIIDAPYNDDCFCFKSNTCDDVARSVNIQEIHKTLHPDNSIVYQMISDKFNPFHLMKHYCSQYIEECMMREFRLRIWDRWGPCHQHHYTIENQGLIANSNVCDATHTFKDNLVWLANHMYILVQT